MNITIKRYSIIAAVSLVMFALAVSVVYAQEDSSWFNIKNILWVFVANVFGWLAGAAAFLLNISITLFIVEFTDTFRGANSQIGTIGASVDIAWVTVRDIFNLTFIFGLIWIGFKMILNSDDSNTRRWLVYLIMAALLVNFSLFITKFIVDISNLTATVIVTEGFPQSPAGDYLIADTFMNRFQIPNIFEADGWMTDKFADAANGGNDYMYIFGSAIILLVCAFVFAAGAIMIMIRFAALCIYMIFSPLMFLGWVFPSMSNITSKYWSGFLGRAFFAPIYILLVYFSALILGSLDTEQANFGAVLGGNGAGVTANIGTTITPFILGSIFLIAAVVVANRMGADGASATIRVGNNIHGRIQRTVVRGAQRGGYGAARGAARGAAYLPGKGYEYGKRRASYALGSSLESQISRMQQSNNRALSAIGRTQAAEGLRTNTATKLKNQKAGFGRQQTREEEQAARNQINNQADARQRITENNAVARDADLTTEAGRTARQDAVNAIARDLRRVSNEEVLSMLNNNPEMMQESAVLSNLSDGQMNAMRDSGRLSNEEFRTMSDARGPGAIDEATIAFEETTSTADELNNAMRNLVQTLSSMNGEQKAGLGYDTLVDERVALNLSDRDLESIEQSGRYDAGRMQDIRAARDTARTNIANGSSPMVDARNPNRGQFINTQRQRLMAGSPQQVGQLPVEVFAEPEMQEFITPEAVEQRMRNGVTDTERLQIRDNIDARIIAAAGTPDQQRIEGEWRTWVERSSRGRQLGLVSL